eukprot:768762-Hanusia_phi.AAC.5
MNKEINTANEMRNSKLDQCGGQGGHGYIEQDLCYLFAIPAESPMLYYLHPDVSFFKGNGFKALGPYLDMPDNSAAGDVSAFLRSSQLCSQPILVGLESSRH